VTAQDDEKGLGDDSNAPNPDATAEEKPSTRDEIGGKRKQDDVAVEAEEDDEEKKPEKRGGHQTKVVRRTASDDGNKAVSLERIQAQDTKLILHSSSPQ